MRDKRRNATQCRIAEATRHCFAEQGYERTTIRQIAQAAKTDPGLVMRYYGSKAKLFNAVSRPAPAKTAHKGDVTGMETLIQDLMGKLEAEPTATLVMLRSMLTHPEAAQEVREIMNEQQRRVAADLGSDDPMLRASLISALALGVVVGRYLLGFEGLREASAGEISRLLHPCFQALAGFNEDGQEPTLS